MANHQTKYWSQVFRVAWADTWAVVIQHSLTTIVRDMALVAVALLLLFWFQTRLVGRGLMSSDNAADTVIWIAITLSALVALFALIFLVEAFFVAPRKIWLEESGAARDLKQRLSEQLVISLPSGDGLTRLDSGTTNHSLGGFVQTAVTSSRQLVSLLCTNTGEKDVNWCVARILAAWKSSDERWEDLGIVEGVKFLWDRDIKNNLRATTRIDPGETQRIYIAVVLPNGAMILYRDYKDMPIEYHRLFVDPGLYRLKLQVNGSSEQPSRFILEIETAAGDAQVNRLPQPKVRIALLSLDGAPLPHLSIAP